MENCCQDKSCEISALGYRHRNVLRIVLVINAMMFIAEGWAGMEAHSTSLLADALDMLGDALVYGFSLFVLTRSARWQARAAVVKGMFMLILGIGVLVEAIHKVFNPVMPGVQTMVLIAGLALIANQACFFLLYRHRTDNLNMNSTWLCARNDLIANLGVLLAAAGSGLFASRWPDIIIGSLIANLFAKSACAVLRQSYTALHEGMIEQVSFSRTVNPVSNTDSNE